MVAACLLATPAAANPAPPAIVGGTPAAPGQYPAQGLLQIGSPATGYCGGTLVGSRWFLTAAHCVTDTAGVPLDPGELWVALGVVHVDATTTLHEVVGVDVHPGWSPLTLQNDVAMLKLSVPYDYAFLPLIGVGQDALWAPGVQARIIGWGATVAGGSLSPDLLQADVPLVGDATCSSAYGLHVPLFDSSTMVCAGDGVHDTCEGDSGGPLMVRNGSGNWVLAGITSWGEGCADPDFPGVYTRLGAPALNAWVSARYPRASFTVGTANVGQATSFTSTSFHPEPDGFTSFVWDLNGDGRYPDRHGAIAAWTFTSAGPHEVGLQASRLGGDTAVARGVIHVNGAPTAEAGGPYRIPEGATRTLVGSGTDPEGGAVMFAWDLDVNGSFETAGATPRYVPRFEGPARTTARMQACDAHGACTVDLAIIDIVNVRPRVNGGRDRIVRRGQRVRFRVWITDPGRERFTIRWTCGNGVRGKGRTVSCRYRRAGRFILRISVADDDGGVGADTVRVRVRR